MKLNHHPSLKPAPRHGFSLIELLIVIVIIGILMALIIPTLASIRRTAAVVQQSAEFSKLDTAISQFASDMGVEPWSEIILTENGTSSTWDPASATKIRRIWPTFNFQQDIDFNGDLAFTGDSSGSGRITLTGSECLLFFLGGMLDRDADRNGSISIEELREDAVVTHVGFSKSPVNPFSKTGSNRQGPWFDFDIARKSDKDVQGNIRDYMPEYFATIGDQSTAVHFASANNGQGYFSGVSIYVQSDGRTPWNKDSHQLVAAGFDNVLGFDPLAGTRMTYANAESVSGNLQQADNVASFKPGSTLGD
jgi:prepilin-type N-terminal cleavage/methylation domain-containing protein